MEQKTQNGQPTRYRYPSPRGGYIYASCVATNSNAAAREIKQKLRSSEFADELLESWDGSRFVRAAALKATGAQQ